MECQKQNGSIGQDFIFDHPLIHNKLRQVMQMEIVKDSIRMLSKEIPDMLFVAQNGQSVSCHRY